jgi:PAS domain S-box-containing protein
MRKPSLQEMAEILERMGKFSQDDELDCGACGYSSCREKAIAVFNDMADPEMCIPYMRQRAESMANVVVEASPNGVIVTSRGGTVIDINQSAERILGVLRKNSVGQPIENFMDPSMFHAAAKTRNAVSGESVIGDFIVQQQTLYLSAQQLLVTILDDVTKSRKEAERQVKVVEEAVAKAQQVIEKQMSVAQKIAGLLGETTAETKLSLTGLMSVMSEGKPGGHEPQS